MVYPSYQVFRASLVAIYEYYNPVERACKSSDISIFDFDVLA